jgi:probable F420-dependent oxidoreductase
LQEGANIAYQSENYRLDRMQPFFNPGPIEHPDIPIYLGAVNPAMIRLAGEIAHGMMTHPTNTSPRYLRERLLPQLSAGAARRAGTACEVIASTFVATGATAADVARERDRIRMFLGFLYSTPQYRATLDLHGWRGVGEKLHALSRNGDWDRMKAEITDEIFDTLVPSGTYDEIAGELRQRYAGLVAAITLRMPDDPRVIQAIAA